MSIVVGLKESSSFSVLVADAAIGAYQRYISPYKGFCCAYRAHTGRRSCSSYGRAILQKLGLMAFILALPLQFDRCKRAYRTLQENREKKRQANKSNQYLDCCDLGELPCHLADAATSVPCDCTF